MPKTTRPWTYSALAVTRNCRPGGHSVLPLLYQAGIALTDFSAISINYGVNGSIWRAGREGLTGQAEPVEVDIFSFSRLTVKKDEFLLAELESLFGR